MEIKLKSQLSPENQKIMAKRIALQSLLGTLGSATGLWIAYKGKKKFWGYVGHMLLFGIIGSGAGFAVGQLVYPKKYDPSDASEGEVTIETEETK